ncbi:hypothetical protein AURDEDRAFT_165278 [Auricularia subglabra TFB-10046 SS5]|nr:hypothetical protein AURDEDRAFT_165278 [Auricularia subglabra TFB-10046 SS5]
MVQVAGAKTESTGRAQAGTLHLGQLSKLARLFNTDYSTRGPNAAVFDDIDWWCARLARVTSARAASTSYRIRRTPSSTWTRPPPSASASFWMTNGIYRNPREGWKRTRGTLAWAGMTAVELGLRATVERGIKGVRPVIRSDAVGAVNAGGSRNPDFVQRIG